VASVELATGKASHVEVAQAIWARGIWLRQETVVPEVTSLVKTRDRDLCHQLYR
jgi:hypothetical protein